jgi:hypothetical protein
MAQEQPKSSQDDFDVKAQMDALGLTPSTLSEVVVPLFNAGSQATLSGFGAAKEASDSSLRGKWSRFFLVWAIAEVVSLVIVFAPSVDDGARKIAVESATRYLPLLAAGFLMGRLGKD